MKKIKFIIIIILVVSSINNLFSQIYIGNKSYKSTIAFNFTKNGNGWGLNNNVNVTIAKRNNSQGMIMLSLPQYSGGSLRKGVIIYLDDGTAISCVDRGLFDDEDDRTLGVWYLTANEINKMKHSDIC